MLLTAVPFFVGATWRLPDTSPSAGFRRGTATLKFYEDRDILRGPAWRNLPGSVTFTTRLSATAVLYAPPPAPSGKRGHPAWKGPRLGTPDQIAATATWRATTVEDVSIFVELESGGPPPEAC